jgi:two-component system, NarL family, sensor kinase
MYIRTFILFHCLLFAVNESNCQNQREADSLIQMLERRDNANGSVRMRLLYLIMIKSSSPDDVLKYSDKLLERSARNSEFKYMVQAYRARGVAQRRKGDLEESLKSFFESAKIAAEHHLTFDESKTYSEIANTYTSNKQFVNALHYKKKAIESIRVQGNQEQLAINLLNTGYSYYNLNHLDSALLLYNEAEPIFDKINLAIGKAYTIGNRALVYWKQGDYQTAEQDLLKAIEMLKPLGDQFGMADYHNQLGNIYLEQGDLEKTIWHTEKSMSMAKDLGLKEQIRDASLLLSELYTGQRQYQKALEYQTQYLAYKDSIENTEQTKKMADMRTEFEVNLREKEINLLEKQQVLQWTYIAIAVGLLILAVVLLLYFRQRFKTTRLLADVERKQQNDKIKNLLGTQETKALHAMVKGRDNERRRLAQELHNHFGSLLATVKVNMNGLDDVSSPKQQTIMGLVDQACDDIRNMSHSLNMGISENFGLVPALRELTTHLKQSGELEVEFSASMGECQIDSENEIIIYRIVQELVSNVLKHAKATKLSILLTSFEEENLINIMVQDNGKGFDTNQISKGMGLNSMREMVDSCQGEIKFDSNSSSGTTVNIDFPITTELNITEI